MERRCWNYAEKVKKIIKIYIYTKNKFLHTAIVIIVRPRKELCAAASSACSATLSKELVASSSIKQTEPRKRVRAKQSNWRWPALNCTPPSPTMVSTVKLTVLLQFAKKKNKINSYLPILSGNWFTKLVKPTFSSASHSSEMA